MINKSIEQMLISVLHNAGVTKVYDADSIVGDEDLYARLVWTPVDVTDKANNLMASKEILSVELYERNYTKNKLQDVANKFKYAKREYEIARDGEHLARLTRIAMASSTPDDFKSITVSLTYVIYMEG